MGCMHHFGDSELKGLTGAPHPEVKEERPRSVIGRQSLLGQLTELNPIPAVVTLGLQSDRWSGPV